MGLEKFVVKNNRNLAIDTDEIIALDFNESLKDLKIHLRGGGTIHIEGKKSAKIWNQLSEDLPELLRNESDETVDEPPNA